MYTEDELLMLSGVQHFKFCTRQWFLIHVEQVWSENEFTTLGSLLHKKVDKPELNERRGNTIILRSVPLVSYNLGVYGLSDAVELRPASDTRSLAFTHPKYPGLWEATPIEYKRGRPKKHNADKLQLCAQAICLEELYGIDIPQGYLYYGESRHREEVVLSPELRKELFDICEDMHEAFRRKTYIPAVYSKKCNSCSLVEVCLPRVNQFESASDYLSRKKLFDV